MDRISDSGSEDLGSNPDGVTIAKREHQQIWCSRFLYYQPPKLHQVVTLRITLMSEGRLEGVALTPGIWKNALPLFYIGTAKPEQIGG